MKQLKFTNQADKFLASLDAKQYRQVGKKVFSLLRNSEPQDSEAMEGAKNGEKRVDVGEYRVVYIATDTLVDVLVIGKRNGDEVYRIWQRML
ncbi:type II toxin-antitoxin system RelE/ParE family toxin [Massilia solisilvae]|uniref:Type II toxin-antitoxin system RelE/ParE family toxin n=1 Tax=Massilia solisilvae TaxID=1811225 RepID=A0ABT2BJ63_9BURK|nr:type II toxin-antitoxin system RelE/ParE family toxin [Massilia solisilvae]MCS0608544.1 type II toxin-antitoxin system RelE/ParE family toxin [Massilia solisilvae]